MLFVRKPCLHFPQEHNNGKTLHHRQAHIAELSKILKALHFLLQSSILSPVPAWLLTLFSRTWQRRLTSLLPQVEIMATLILNSLEIHHFCGFRPRERARLLFFKLIGTPKNTRQNATDLQCFFSWTRSQSDLTPTLGCKLSTFY